MSNSSHPIPKGTGNKIEEEPDFEPVVFPPLMSTLDVYMDASSDLRYNQVVEKVKANKKKSARKVKKKAPQNNVVQMEPLVNLNEANLARPESRVSTSQDAPRTQFRLRNYSTPSGDREDYNFDSLSLESASKTISNDRKVHISSPPPSSDRKQSSRPNFTPYSPARILVQPSSQVGFNANKSAAHRSPPEGFSPNSQHTHAPVKSDLGFGKAVESIAAIKLHNFAMKRRDHVSQKLKLLREIRSMQKENEADFVEAKKIRKDEILAAWKIRYYVEYLRLNSVRHIVDHTTQKNLELEEECSLLQQTAAVAEIENESLAKEIARLTAAHADATALHQQQTATLQGQIQDLTYQVQSAVWNHQQSEEHGKETQELLVQARVATMQEQQQIERLQSELNITRMTCQELVKAAAQKDSEIQDLSSELHALHEAHAQSQEALRSTQLLHCEERENSRMREEDNEIRHLKANALHAQMHDAERTLRTYETDFNRMSQEVLSLQEKLAHTTSQLSTERSTIAGIEQEKSGLQKLLSELAKRLTQADEDKVKAHSVEKQHKSDLKAANNTISTLQHSIEDLEAQLNAAHDEIEFLVEENHELAREMECHHMYGEEMDQRYATTTANAERSLEYSRFLEEELFCARKLYEKSSAHYNDIAHMGSGNNNNHVSPMFGEVSEESYGYRVNTNDHATNQATNNNHSDQPDGQHHNSSHHHTTTRSSIEQLTGLDPVQPITIMHLNSFSKGARNNSRSGRNEFERPHSASMYNPDSRPNSTGAGNSTIMAEQRLLMVLNTIEERMKNVDRAADSLRFLAEKADAIEKVQTSTASILQTASTAAALARQPVRLSVQREQQAAEKQSAVDKHISMERVFSELQASLEHVNADLTAQQATIVRLQERRAECKDTVSNMKKRLRKSRKASMKDPHATFVTEDEENETESQMNQLNNEIEQLKEQINTYKAESVNLNAQSIAMQTQLYHLDQDLEKSATAFFAQYNEHITAYYPAELAHLIEDGHAEEHGRYTITAPLDLQLNTLYERDEDDEGTCSVITSNSNNPAPTSTPSLSHASYPATTTSTGAGAYLNTSASVTSGMESGVALEHSVELNAALHNDNSSMGEMSELESSFFLDSPTARKKAKKSKSRRSSEAYMSEDGFELPSSRERKASKLPKMHKQKSTKSRKHRSKSDSFGEGDNDGDTEEGMEGMNLEEGSSDTVDPVNTKSALQSGIYDGVVGHVSLHHASNTGSNSSGVGGSLDRNESVYNAPNQRLYTNNHTTTSAHTASSDSHDMTPRWNSPLTNYTANLNHSGSPYYPPYALANPGSAYSSAFGSTFNTPSPSRGRPHSEADRAARQQQHAARERLAHLRTELESHITQLDAALDGIEQLADQRAVVRGHILQWIMQYMQLCGCAPSVEDKLRSTTLQPHLHAFNHLQTDLQLAHSQAANLAEVTLQLRNQLLHEQHSQHSRLPIEQLEEQLVILYPISTVEEVYMEDPLMIPGDEELASMQPLQQGSVDDHMYSSTDAVSDLSASLQGSLTLPSTINTMGIMNNYQVGQVRQGGQNAYYSDTRYNANSGQSQINGNAYPQHIQQNLEESSITSEASSRSEKKARKAAKKAAKRSKSSKEKGDSRDYQSNAAIGIGYTNSNPNTNGYIVTTSTAGGGDGSSVTSAAEEDDVQVNHSQVPNAVKSDQEAIVKTADAQKEVVNHSIPTTAAATTTVAPEDEHSHTSFPSTPYSTLSNNLLTTLTATDFTALATESQKNPSSISPKNTKSNKNNPNNKNDVIVSSTWAGMFADPVITDIEALQAEQTALNAQLREWASEYSAKYGRKPVPADYDSFSTEIKAKIYRKNFIKKVLKDDANSVITEMSGSPTAEWRAKQIVSNNNTNTYANNNTTDFSTLPTSAADHPDTSNNNLAPQYTYDINTDPNIYSTYTNTSNAVNNNRYPTADGDSLSGFSLPNTPYYKNRNDSFGNTNDETAETEAFSDMLSLSDQLSSGKVTVESLLQEQTTLREEIRTWTQEFINLHNRRPTVEDFQSFETDIKLKLIRKNQIKKLLLDFGITSSVSRKYGGANNDFGVLVDELSEEQLEAIRTGRPTSTSKKEFTASGASSRNRSASPSAKGRSTKHRGRTPDHARNSQKNKEDRDVDGSGHNNRDDNRADNRKDYIDDNANMDRPVRQKDIDTKNVPLQLPSYPATTITSNTEDALAFELQQRNAHLNGSRASTAQSVNSAYSVPTTPYADQFATLEGTERSSEHNHVNTAYYDANTDFQDNNSIYDQSIKIPNAFISTSVNTHLNTKHVPIAQLEAELKALKKDLRKWNINFMRQHGRLPAPEDFPLFDEEVKEKLQRKRYLSACISDANWDNTHTTVSDPLITNSSYEANNEDTITTTSNDAVDLSAIADTIAKDPYSDTAPAANDTIQDNGTIQDVSELAVATLEFNTIKSTLKQWQQQFIHTYQREPSEDDLPQDILHLGERRNALKAFIKAHGGSVSSRVSSAAAGASHSDIPSITIDTTDIVDPTSESASGMMLSPTKPTSAPNSNGRPKRGTKVTSAETSSREGETASVSKLTLPTISALEGDGVEGSDKDLNGGVNASPTHSSERASSPKANKRVSFIAAAPAASATAGTGAPVDTASINAAGVTNDQDTMNSVDSIVQAVNAAAAVVDVHVSPHIEAEPSENVNYSDAQNTQDSPVEVENPEIEYFDEPVEYNIPELTKEYAKIKKQLKKWQKEFIQEHNREPMDDDFDSVDESLKELIVRKYELKDILGELGESPKSKKSKKSKKDARD